MIFNCKIIVFVIFIFCSLSAFSQTDIKKFNQKDTNIYYGYEVDKVAHFKKDFDLMNFFNLNFKYKKYIDQGFVINIAFIVEKDGSITFHKGKNTPLYDSVIQIIKKLPKIYPAKLKNKKVRSAYYFRVFFCDNNILGFGLEEEALRLVDLMPKWIPGKQYGKIVRVKFVLPINFNPSKNK